jgi:nitric oxide reductase subunit C
MRRTALIRAALLAALISGAMATAAHAGADEGKALYQQKCRVCHSVAGDAGKMADKGGKLDGVGAKHDADWLTKYLRDPKSVMPDAKMPKVKMTDQELADYVAYMLTLK